MSSPAPCIVLGVETQIGLAIVRELGSAGVPVIAVSHDPRALGLYSRHVWRRVVAGPPRSEALLAILRGLGETHGQCTLITVSEANLMWLSQHRDELGAVLPVLPSGAALEAVLDKQRTFQFARDAGLAVPRTEQPTTLDEVDQAAARFPFPAVLKWKNPNTVAPLLASAGLALEKAEYVYTADELRAVGRRYAGIGQWPLIQQYCAGQGFGQFFFMHRGQAVRRFQHLRVAEWPPEGGFSSVCDAVPLSAHAELQTRSIALLQAIGWEGVAMVEFRLDTATGQAWLMEINGRFWGSLPLAVHAGAGFALLAHSTALAQLAPALPLLRDDLRCRMVVTEIKRLVRLIIQPGRVSDRQFKISRWHELRRFVVDFARPRVRYYVWKLDDPLPFLRDLLNSARGLVGLR